ncbi:hypothetical protein ILYODFUR_034910 [Ilyodon furcidens]|uniref:Uncharacterized protein n=1 Tax=Ilyodon furcidens TaxID=33524 RepID=A0ABV0T455_9TELE
MNRLTHSASNSFRVGDPSQCKAYTVLLSLGLLLQNQPAPAMSYGCSRSALAYSCGLTNCQMVSESHKVSVHFEENESHLLMLVDLFASPSDSCRMNGSLNGKDPLLLVDGLCWCGNPRVSYAYCRYNI